MRPLLSFGRNRLAEPFATYGVEVNYFGRNVLATVVNGINQPLVTFGVASSDIGAAVLWSGLSRLYRQISNLPGYGSADFLPPDAEPPPAPWLATVIVFSKPAEAAWIADFERCFAWAWIESQGAATDDTR